MSLITLKHGNRHSAGGTDPINIADLFDGASSSDTAAARVDLGAAPLGDFHIYLMTVTR